jgi:hypothetical protein
MGQLKIQDPSSGVLFSANNVAASNLTALKAGNGLLSRAKIVEKHLTTVFTPRYRNSDFLRLWKPESRATEQTEKWHFILH